MIKRDTEQKNMIFLACPKPKDTNFFFSKHSLLTVTEKFYGFKLHEVKQTCPR